MSSCVLTSLKTFEVISLFFGGIVIYLLSDVMNDDINVQQEVLNYGGFSIPNFGDPSRNSTPMAKSFKSYQAENFEVTDFITKNVNWEYLCCVLQSAMMLMAMGHIFCQFQFSKDTLTSKISKIVSKLSSYCAVAGCITLMISITYSEDKRFKMIVDFASRKMLRDGKVIAADPRLDWLCPTLEPVLFKQESIDDIIERQVCEYGYAKCISMFLLLVQCVVYALMYNYAKAEKFRLGRVALTRFVVDRTPVPAQRNNHIVASSRTGNRIVPIPIPHSLLNYDLPPSYEAVLMNATKPDSVVQMPDPNRNQNENANVMGTASAPLYDSNNLSPPSYEFALLQNGNKII